MSRKRKNADVEGDSRSNSRNSKGNDAKNRSKKQVVDPTMNSSKNMTQHQLSAVEKGPSLGGEGGGDAPWSKSKKKRMRLLKGKLLKKEQDPAPNADTTVRPTGKNSCTNPKGASPKQQQNTKPMTGTSETQTNNDTSADSSLQPRAAQVAAAKAPLPPRGSSALQEAFKARLSGSRFRILNEELYTTTSATAFERFSAHPELYDEYHDGFRSQVEHWPVNPVDVIVGRLKKEVDIFVANKNDNKQQTPDSIIENKQIVVADFGCGDADLAKQLLKIQIPIQKHQQEGRKRKKGGGSDDKSNANRINSTTWCPFRVHSFDLVSQSDLVTACDMSNVPLKNDTVDVAVFCLSLMGTNLADFLREAHRVLKSTGRLKIAEVKSRFSSSSTTSSTLKSNTNNKTSKKSRNNSNKKNKNDDTAGQDEEREFIHVLNKLGFECTRKDRSNKMFVLFELRKNGKNPDPKVEYTAKPCIYKRR